ncbi:hypothetical protein S40288_04411 [Stachybotrys chartarum IBT 40288]|nr:hypothetical protein S40288_04411 [Stachybotrys chartarum IBT 40288]
MIPHPHQAAPVRLIQHLAPQHAQHTLLPQHRRAPLPLARRHHPLQPVEQRRPGIPLGKAVREPGAARIPRHDVDVERPRAGDGVERAARRGDVEGDERRRLQRERGEGRHGHGARCVVVHGRADDDGVREEAHQAADLVREGERRAG